MATVTDKETDYQVFAGTETEYSISKLASQQDYYPFGIAKIRWLSS